MSGQPWICMHGTNVDEVGGCRACEAALAAWLARVDASEPFRSRAYQRGYQAGYKAGIRRHPPSRNP